MEDRNTDMKRAEAKTDKAELKQKEAPTSKTWWIIRQKEQNRSNTYLLSIKTSPTIQVEHTSAGKAITQARTLTKPRMKPNFKIK